MAVFTVDGATRRVDVFLTERVAGWSRRRSQKALADGVVFLRRPGFSARRARKGEMVAPGDEILLEDSLLAPRELPANSSLPIRIVYQDADIIVVDKPPGLASVALGPGESETVANFLLAHVPTARRLGRSGLESGLVHRLDTQTSGLLVAAKNEVAFENLRGQFRDQRVSKQYLAAVHGHVPSEGSIDTPLLYHRGTKRMVLARDPSQAGRRARTWFRPLKISPPPAEDFAGDLQAEMRTLLWVRIETGVMHQIRVHLASIGHPLVGDLTYGSQTSLLGGRHLLHASRLELDHPVTGRSIEFSSPTPADFGTFADVCA